MADFSGQDITPIQAGESVKAGVQVQPTDTSTNQLYGVKAGVSALAGLADLGGKVVERFDKIQANKNTLKLTEALSTVVDGVNQGLVDFNLAQTQYRSIITTMASQDPTNAEHYLDTGNKIWSSAGFSASLNVAKERADRAEKAEFETLSKAVEKGLASWDQVADPSGKINNYGRGILSDYQVAQYSEGLMEREQKRQTLINSRLAQLTAEQGLATGNITQQKARVELANAVNEKNAKDAAVKIAQDSYPLLTAQAKTIFENKELKEHEKIAALEAMTADTVSKAAVATGVYGPGAEFYGKTLKAVPDVYIKILKGEIPAEVAKNSLAYTEASLQSAAFTDKNYQQAFLFGKLGGKPEAPTVVSNAISNWAANTVFKTDYGKIAASSLFKRNGTKEGFSGNPYTPVDGSDNKDWYPKALAGAMTEYGSTASPQVTPEIVSEVRQGIEMNLYNLAKGISEYSSMVTSPKQMSHLLEALQHPEAARIFKAKENDPEWDSVRKAASNVFNEKYYNEVFPLLEQTFKKEGVSLYKEGESFPDNPTGPHIPTSKLVNIVFEGNQVVAKPASIMRAGGVSQQDINMKVKALNAPGGVISKVNQLLNTYVTLNGTDAKDAWEKHFVPSIQPPKPKEDNSSSSPLAR